MCVATMILFWCPGWATTLFYWGNPKTLHLSFAICVCCIQRGSIPGNGTSTEPLTSNIRIRFCVRARSEEHTSELQSRPHLVCRLLLEKKKSRHSGCRSRH